MTLGIKKNHEHNREQIIKTLVNLQYKEMIKIFIEAHLE